MSTESKRLSALREYHAQRIVNTRTKLTEALDRIEADNTVVLEAGSKLTKTNLCLEAGVSIHTLLKKIGKTKRRRFADIISRLETLAKKKGRKNTGDDKDEKIAELRGALRGAEADKLNMALEIDDIGMKLLMLVDTAVRIANGVAQLV